MNEAQVLGCTLPTFSVSLFMGLECIQTMQFKKETDDTLNLVRNVSKIGMTVIGGSSKIFKHAVSFIKKTMPQYKNIVTYAIRDLTPFQEDAVYTRLGFKPLGDVGPSRSYYVHRNVKLGGRIFLRSGVYNRQLFMKYKLNSFNGALQIDGYPFMFNEAISADENLAKLGIYPVFNSGCWKYIYKL